MKLQATATKALLVTAYGDGYIAIDGRTYARDACSSLLLHAQGIDTSWQVAAFEQLGSAHFAMLAACPGEILLLGTGKRQRFPAADLLQALLARGKTLEIMDTHAACRTYNILAAEARSVAAALIIE